MNQTQTNRIEVVDALRGLALCAIVIVHCFEHYNLYYIPESAPQWLTALDREVWNTTWFLLAGKAFSTFSLLFGFSFFIQLDNAARRGMPFRVFSQLHSLFYNGDILLLYSIMGLLLVALCRLSTRVVLTVAVIMILQPLEWIRLLCTLLDIPFLNYGNHWLTYAKLAKPVMESGNVWEVIVSNITDRERSHFSDRRLVPLRHGGRSGATLQEYAGLHTPLEVAGAMGCRAVCTFPHCEEYLSGMGGGLPTAGHAARHRSSFYQ